MDLPESNDLFVIIGGEWSHSSNGELGDGCHGWIQGEKYYVTIWWDYGRAMRISFIGHPQDKKNDDYPTNAECSWSLRVMLDIGSRRYVHIRMLPSVRTPYINTLLTLALRSASPITPSQPYYRDKEKETRSVPAKSFAICEKLALLRNNWRLK